MLTETNTNSYTGSTCCMLGNWRVHSPLLVQVHLLKLLKSFSPCSFLKSFSDIVTGKSSSPTGGWMLTLKCSSFVLGKEKLQRINQVLQRRLIYTYQLQIYYGIYKQCKNYLHNFYLLNPKPEFLTSVKLMHFLQYKYSINLIFLKNVTFTHNNVHL